MFISSLGVSIPPKKPIRRFPAGAVHGIYPKMHPGKHPGKYPKTSQKVPARYIPEISRKSKIAIAYDRKNWYTIINI